MQKIESLQEFYKKIHIQSETLGIDRAIGHFNVFPRRYCSPSAAYHRRDFYKISLITRGEGVIQYASKDIQIDRPALFFSNPLVAHSWQPTTDTQEGWFCLFTEEFLHSWRNLTIIHDHPISYMDKNPVVFLDNDALEEASYLYKMMLKEIASDYPYKYSILHNYLQLLIHLSIRNRSLTSGTENQPDASHRITFRFLDLLENQFPIENSEIPLKLRTVCDYAKMLSVHENHLNYVVKSVTGKNPSQHIILRLIQEAKALLRNTDWSISNIAYGLSFEYPSHFTSFFKRNTGVIPTEFRKKINI